MRSKIFGGPNIAILRIDEKGRVIIPGNTRKRTELREGSHAKIITKEKSIIIEPIELIADKCFGAHNVTELPKDLGELIFELIRR